MQCYRAVRLAANLMYLVQAQPEAETLADKRVGTFGPIATAIRHLARPPRRLFKQGRCRYSFRRFVGSVLPQQCMERKA